MVSATSDKIDPQVFKSFAAAAKAYFGLKPGEDLRGFMNEVSELSPADKDEMMSGMSEHGIKIVS
jgi:hypothetical protein